MTTRILATVSVVAVGLVGGLAFGAAEVYVSPRRGVWVT